MVIIFQIIQLVMAILHAVHDVQEVMGAGNGAAKSEAVITKVTPIADSIGANKDQIQSVIDLAVGLYKSSGVEIFNKPEAGAGG